MSRLIDSRDTDVASATRDNDRSVFGRSEKELFDVRSTSLAALVALFVIGLGSPAFAQGRQLYPEGSIFLDPPMPHSMMWNGGNAAERSAHRSPLDPLGAPDAGSVWKPSNRDAGNFAQERWEVYAKRGQDVTASPAESPPSKNAPADGTSSADVVDDFFSRMFR